MRHQCSVCNIKKKISEFNDSHKCNTCVKEDAGLVHKFLLTYNIINEEGILQEEYELASDTPVVSNPPTTQLIPTMTTSSSLTL